MLETDWNHHLPKAMDRKGLTVMMQQYANKETGALFLIQQYEVRSSTRSFTYNFA